MAGKYPLSLIMKGGQIENVIVQVLGSQRIVSGSSDTERYRLLLSDGKYVVPYVLLNDPILKGGVPNNSIIKIKKYLICVINHSGITRSVLVILDMETLVPGTKIGELKQLPIDNIPNINAAPSNADALMLNNILEDFSYLDIMD